MRDIFKIEGDIFVFLNRLANLILVNCLFIIFSLPIFTIGSSFGALNRTIYELFDDQHLSVVKVFYQDFKANFSSYSKIFVFQIIGGILLALLYFFILFFIPYFSLFFFVSVVLFLMFFELPYFLVNCLSEISMQKIFRWSAFIVVRELPYLIIIISIPLCLFIALPLISVHFIYFLIMFGFSLCIFLQQIILKFILKKYKEEIR